MDFKSYFFWFKYQFKDKLIYLLFVKMFKPFSKLILNSETNEEYFEIVQILENTLLSLISEKGLIQLITSYLFSEIVLFDSVLLSDCVDFKIKSTVCFILKPTNFSEIKLLILTVKSVKI